MPDLNTDIPSPIDLRTMEHAIEWAASASVKRPWRETFCQRIIDELRPLQQRPIRILELGSGPGFLAQAILKAIPGVHYTLLDFSPAMHELARERLGSLMQYVRPILADFKNESWCTGLGEFDVVVTQQAVHELRHKKHALGLHRKVRSLLSADGRYLVCDHYVGSEGMRNSALYMTVDEQRQSLDGAGFGTVTNILEMQGLVLHRASGYSEVDCRWKQAELRSFGRRHGRKLSPRQDRLLRDVLPRVRVDLGHPPQDQLPSPGTPLWLEIGFGGGELLLRQAARNPGVRLIGCEPFEEGVVKVLSTIDTDQLDNIRLHPDDARPLLRWLPAGSVDRAFILFPDPWPKKRHIKRRLVSATTLALLARVLKPGAELRIATDIGDYLRTILIAAAETPQLPWQAQSAADWRIRPDDWPETRYEAKAVREGRQSYYLKFRRVS